MPLHIIITIVVGIVALLIGIAIGCSGDKDIERSFMEARLMSKQHTINHLEYLVALAKSQGFRCDPYRPLDLFPDEVSCVSRAMHEMEYNSRLRNHSHIVYQFQTPPSKQAEEISKIKKNMDHLHGMAHGTLDAAQSAKESSAETLKILKKAIADE